LKKEEQIVAHKKKNAEASKPKPYGPEKPDWMIQKKPNPYDPPSLQPKIIKKLAKSDSTAATDATTAGDVLSNEKTATVSITKQHSNDVKIVSAKVEPVVESTTKSLESKLSLEKKAEDAGTSEHEHSLTVEPLKSEDEQFEKIAHIPKEELVELQIIAGDEDSESDFGAGEDWEYNEEDYDDEESEDEFGRTRGSLFPFSIPHTIQKSIEEKRNKNTATLALETSIKHDDNKEPAIIKKEIEESEAKKLTVSSSGNNKRQVRFAETVNVKTFEKDSREVHGNIHGNMQNLFEIAREQMEQNAGQPVATTFKQQLENLLYPNGVPQDEDFEYEKINTPLVDEEIEVKTAPKVSRFKAARLNAKRQEEQQQQNDAKDPESIKVSPVNTNIVERDFIPINNNEQSKKNSKLFTATTPKAFLSFFSASSQASASTSSGNLSSPNKVSASNPKEEKKSSPTTDKNSATNSTSRQSVFKRLNSNKSKNRFPISSRIEEVKSEEVPAVPVAVGDVSKFTIPLKTLGNNNPSISSVPTSRSSSDSTRQGINTIKPGLVQGMGSLLSAEVLAKAEDYYQQSLLSEEDFIKAHSVESDEEEENKDDTDGGKEQQDYQSRPIVEENLIEREFAPPVDSRGMGYVPAKYLHDDNESDEEDFTVSRAEIANEYQKIRQSLIYQTGGYGKSIEELELEPVDEDGNARKVSRFKAARLSTRRAPKF
jgi:hypothetical protein